jgi:hypothetical protein
MSGGDVVQRFAGELYERVGTQNVVGFGISTSRERRVRSHLYSSETCIHDLRLYEKSALIPSPTRVSSSAPARKLVSKHRFQNAVTIDGEVRAGVRDFWYTRIVRACDSSHEIFRQFARNHVKKG